MREILERLCRGEDLSQPSSAELFGRVVRGELSAVQITALLVALKAKGEAIEEIAGAAQALRDAALSVPIGDVAVADTCGTGGDGLGTVNVSTAAALVVAEAGVPVAKHGNRSVSSRCGSADVLEHCGVRIDASARQSAHCLRTERICFLFAPQYHSGMRHAMPVRRELATRTVFNLIGPLANPAAPRWQVVGVYDPALCVPMARTLGLLGCASALVVHGSGLDEVALHGPTLAAYLHQGQVTELTLQPSDLGLPSYPLEALAGGSGEENARWLQTLLDGRGEPAHAAAVAANAGALLHVAGRGADAAAGVGVALEVLSSARAGERLRRWADLSHAEPAGTPA